MGRFVFWTLSKIARHFALNSEMAISFIVHSDYHGQSKWSIGSRMLATSADGHGTLSEPKLTLLRCTSPRFFVNSRKFFAILRCQRPFALVCPKPSGYRFFFRSVIIDQ